MDSESICKYYMPEEVAKQCQTSNKKVYHEIIILKYCFDNADIFHFIAISTKEKLNCHRDHGISLLLRRLKMISTFDDKYNLKI